MRLEKQERKKNKWNRVSFLKIKVDKSLARLRKKEDSNN